VRLGVLFSILDHSFEDSGILGHNLRLEGYLDISIFMRHDLHLFLEDLKTKLFGLLLTALAYVEAHCARNLVEVTDFEFLHDSIRILRREQCAEVETLLLNAENI
jgi:hypothetical protein